MRGLSVSLTKQIALMVGGVCGLLALAALVPAGTGHQALLGAGVLVLAALGVRFSRWVQQVGEQERRLRGHLLELQRANFELEQLANFKDEFLLTVNHQLRTPLTAIVEGLELIRDEAAGHTREQQRALAEALSDNALRLARLVEGVFDLTLLKSGRRSLERQPTAVSELLQDVCKRWQTIAVGKTVRLACGCLPAAYIDAQAIREVLDHLLRNALRHAPPASEIVMAACARDGMVEVSVKDQGPGMSDEQLDRLFEPFVHIQAPDAPGSQGAGLGLAFCRQVIQRHRGAIRAEPLQPQGMSVTFSLPVASPAFLIRDACQCAKKDSEYARGQFGLLLLAPRDLVAGEETVHDSMRGAESLVRRHTHRGDRFVWLDDRTLAIVAVTDAAGLSAMVQRLGSLLDQHDLDLQLASARYPFDGDEPARLIEAARNRLRSPHEAGLHATIHGEPSC